MKKIENNNFKVLITSLIIKFKWNHDIYYGHFQIRKSGVSVFTTFIFNACFVRYTCYVYIVLIDVSLTVKAATLIFISECGSAISSAKEGESGFIYNLVKS